jgi:hypothetical protein
MNTYLIVSLFIFLLLCGCISSKIYENFRGRRGGGWRGGRSRGLLIGRGGRGGNIRPGRPGRPGMVIRPGRPGGHMRPGRHHGRRGGRGGWRPDADYIHRFRRRDNGDNYRSWWGGFTFPMWNYFWPGSYNIPCNCKNGCTMDGCAFPGNGPDDCVWASDCNCCGYV